MYSKGRSYFPKGMNVGTYGDTSSQLFLARNVLFSRGSMIDRVEFINPESINDSDIEETENTINIENYDQSSYQFCTECLVEGNNIDRKLMKEKLTEMGDSFILAGTKSKVKIHIHTDSPQKVFKFCQEFGEVKNQKADDMHQQVASSHDTNSKIAIVTDSGCDIQYDTHNSNIHIVPVRYSFGDKEYIDKISQTTEQFYNELKTNPVHPKTSQPPIGDFLNKYENLSTHYKSIISIHIPEKISGTLQSARNAKKKIKNFNITDIDSCSASVGLGLIIKSASKLFSRFLEFLMFFVETELKTIRKYKSLLILI